MTELDALEDIVRELRNGETVDSRELDASTLTGRAAHLILQARQKNAKLFAERDKTREERDTAERERDAARAQVKELTVKWDDAIEFLRAELADLPDDELLRRHIRLRELILLKCERIKEIETERDAARAHVDAACRQVERLQKDVWKVVEERDAALARVKELEDRDCHTQGHGVACECVDNAKAALRQAEKERDAALARVTELETELGAARRSIVEMEAKLDRGYRLTDYLERLKARCDFFDITEALLSGERLGVTVQWLDRRSLASKTGHRSG